MATLLHQLLDRRDFLKTAALSGTALAVVGCRTTASDTAHPAGLHLALLSDPHIPADRKNTYRGFQPWENFRNLVPKLLAARPQGIVFCGDLAREEGTVADYQEFRTLLAPLTAQVPAYLGLGNHDNRTNFLQVFTAMSGTRAPVTGKVVTAVENPAVRLLVLDSLLHTNKVPGLLGRVQREWLARALAAADRPTVLFVHHTLGENDDDLLDADMLFALVRDHRQVKAIFYGHSHRWELNRRDHLHLINLPALGYNFRDQDPVGWVDARFGTGGVSLTLHAVGGNRTADGQAHKLTWAY